MGVWSAGERSRLQAVNHPDQRRVYDEVLPGWTDSDVAASPYAISGYNVPEQLGGEAGLAGFRKRLHEYGLKLILDFVPNHFGLDHPWLDSHPELLVGSAARAAHSFAHETTTGPRWFAHGRDPCMPAWTDTVQIDYRSRAARAAMAEELRSVAVRCDGVRCDMAMLVLRDVFDRTWEKFPRQTETVTIADLGGPNPIAGEAEEFWSHAIASIKATHRDFLFLAEVYWNLEGRLQSLGFDYTYDKTLYDRIIAHDSVGIQNHLLGMGSALVSRCAHFLENHDERRIASLLGPAEHRAAALLILALPGMRFLHEGQLEGAQVRLPVQVVCRPAEPARAEIARIYTELLGLLPRTQIGQGRAELLPPRPVAADNSTAQHIVLIRWEKEGGAVELVAVNMAPHRSECLAPVKPITNESAQCTITELFTGQSHRVSAPDLKSGLCLELPDFGTQILRFEVV